MVFRIKQWESKYIRDFCVVKEREISEEDAYRKLAAMYYDYVSTNGIEPFVITYGRGQGFCVNANSHVGVIVYDDITLCIDSMIPELTLGKILYLQSQAEEVTSDSTTRKLLTQQLADEEGISAVDYYIISLLNAVENIKQNGMISALQNYSYVLPKIAGKLNTSEQIKKHPAFDAYHVEKTEISYDIPINSVIKTALKKARELSQIEWVLPIIADAEDYFRAVSYDKQPDVEEFPKVTEYTTIRRDDYEKALLFSKYILFGFDPLDGENEGFFPEFMLDMNRVFEYYVTVGLKKLFKEGFEYKKEFTLGVGPEDIPIDKKNIELDGFYSKDGVSIVVDTKNKYKRVIDKPDSDFMASNPDIFQQYYYASRVGAGDIILVYPSGKSRNAPLASYKLNFKGNKPVDMYLWGLQITSTPRENKNALIRLAEYMEKIAQKKAATDNLSNNNVGEKELT